MHISLRPNAIMTILATAMQIMLRVRAIMTKKLSGENVSNSDQNSKTYEAS